MALSWPLFPAAKHRMHLAGSLDSLAQDIRSALRDMRRAPAFTAVAVLTLAVGIGVNTTVATVTSAVLFKGFRLVERNDRLAPRRATSLRSSSSRACFRWESAWRRVWRVR